MPPWLLTVELRWGFPSADKARVTILNNHCKPASLPSRPRGCAGPQNRRGLTPWAQHRLFDLHLQPRRSEGAASETQVSKAMEYRVRITPGVTDDTSAPILAALLRYAQTLPGRAHGVGLTGLTRFGDHQPGRHLPRSSGKHLRLPPRPYVAKGMVSGHHPDTERDQIWLSPALAFLCTPASIQPSFADHSTVLGCFSFAAHQPSFLAWPRPSEIPWGQIDLDSWQRSLPRTCHRFKAWSTQPLSPTQPTWTRAAHHHAQLTTRLQSQQTWRSHTRA